MGTTTEDFENQEVQDIIDIINDGSRYNPDPDWKAIQLLIKTLVSNGTLTAAQVKRALRKAD